VWWLVVGIVPEFTLLTYMSVVGWETLYARKGDYQRFLHDSSHLKWLVKCILHVVCWRGISGHAGALLPAASGLKAPVAVVTPVVTYDCHQCQYQGATYVSSYTE
jgi:hypothetical protein